MVYWKGYSAEHSRLNFRHRFSPKFYYKRTVAAKAPSTAANLSLRSCLPASLPPCGLGPQLHVSHTCHMLLINACEWGVTILIF